MLILQMEDFLRADAMELGSYRRVMGHSPLFTDYQVVYMTPDYERPLDVCRRFEQGIPSDFHGRILSVSDVIINGSAIYYIGRDGLSRLRPEQFLKGLSETDLTETAAIIAAGLLQTRSAGHIMQQCVLSDILDGRENTLIGILRGILSEKALTPGRQHPALEALNAFSSYLLCGECIRTSLATA